MFVAKNMLHLGYKWKNNQLHAENKFVLVMTLNNSVVMTSYVSKKKMFKTLLNTTVLYKKHHVIQTKRQKYCVSVEGSLKMLDIVMLFQSFTY